MRRSRKRRRHLPAVAPVICMRLAIWLLGSPSAAASTMRARKESAAGTERQRAIELNCERSDSLSTRCAPPQGGAIRDSFGLPVGRDRELPERRGGVLIRELVATNQASAANRPSVDALRWSIAHARGVHEVASASGFFL